MERPDIPYIDLVLESIKDGRAPREFHLHYGYWEDPETPPTLDAYPTTQARMVDVLLEHLVLPPGATILDVGCGVGGAVAHVDSRYAGVSLIGLNIDQRQLEAAAELVGQTRNGVRWVCADACDLPLPLESVDAAISIEALPHFPSRLTALREMRRVLKPGGRFAFVDLTSTPEILRQHPAAERDGCRDRLEQGFGPWPELWEPTDYASVAPRAELSVVVDRDITAHVLPSTRWMVFPGADDVSRAVNTSTDQLTRWMETAAIEYRLVVLERSQAR